MVVRNSVRELLPNALMDGCAASGKIKKNIFEERHSRSLTKNKVLYSESEDAQAQAHAHEVSE